ncbi:FecR family protein [Flavobacterium sp.]|uniref:FecR family protein n=1 Tax=Flavobacterium sp. TaxID=239 RepID=UPI0039E56C96
MNNPEPNNEYFLSEWIEGRLTDAELQAKVPLLEYEAYLKLRQSLDGLAFPEPDMEQHYRAIKHKKAESLDRQPAKTFRLFPWFAAAAAVLLLFGMYQFLVFSNRVSTGFGQRSEVVLADGSKVILNNKSSVAYPNGFALRRKLELSGEAFFKVSKGKRFTVETAQGSVSVLGTQFNVIAQKDYFEVNCYEGKVSVHHQKQHQILTPGQSVRFYENQTEQWQQEAVGPGWIRGESTFKNAPLESVLRQLENQYHREVDYPESLKGVRFTGSFTHCDLQTALRSICIPLQMQCDQTPDGKIVFSE